MPTDTEWIHYNLRDRDTLLITAGESWTWGDSLPAETRLTSIYGHHLANHLDSDFINIAKCGAPNKHIHDQTLDMINQVKDQYRQVYVVFTLTELCREARQHPLWMPISAINLDDLLLQYERTMLQSFQTNFVEQFPLVKFILARNFTYTFKENLDVCTAHVEKTWIDILSQYQNKNDYPDDLRLLSEMGFRPLIRRLEYLGWHEALKEDLITHLTASNLAITWLENSSLNYKEATKHPTALGHQLWADYLFEVIQQNSMH